MKAMFLRIGDSTIATDAFMRLIGLEPIQTHAPNNATISRGVLYAPEFACFPFKVTLGLLMQGLEQGVEVYISPAGRGQVSCQLSDFGAAQEYITRKTGKQFELVELTSIQPQKVHAQFVRYNPKLTLTQTTNALLVGRQKMLLYDALVDYYRAIYIAAGKKKAERFHAKWEHKIKHTDKITKLLRMGSSLKKDADSYPKINTTGFVKIGVIGDIYCLNERTVNNNIYERLLSMGVIVGQGTKISALLGGKLSLSPSEIVLEGKAEKYLRHNVAAFAKDTIKDAIRFAEEGYDGIIQIYPFNCMPEITVRNILPKVGQDYHVPILYLPIDEQTGDAGFTTRIEAFVDLIKLRKGKKTLVNESVAV